MHRNSTGSAQQRTYFFHIHGEGGNNYLHLLSIPAEDGPIDLAAIAIWMDKGVEQRPRFRIGMQFLQRQKELISYLKKNRLQNK